MDQITLGIVIPVFHSMVSVARLIEELHRIFLPVCTYHIYLVDDGNPEETAAWLKQRCCGPHVTLIRLKRNYGQQNAILCGIRHSLGCRYIATMDDDLQHDAAMLLTLYRAIEEGFDIVYAAPFPKACCPDPQVRLCVRSVGSRMRDRLFRVMLKLPLDIKVSSFRIMTGELAEEISRHASGFFYLSAAVFTQPRKAKTCFYEPRPRMYRRSSFKNV